MAATESRTRWWRDVLTVVLGPPALGGVAGSVVGTYLAITGSIQDARAGLAAPLSGLAPIGAGIGALYALLGIPLAALAVWWVRRTGSRVGARGTATIAGTSGPAGVMMADASSAPLAHTAATWAVAALGIVLIAAALWALLGRILPDGDRGGSRARHEDLEPGDRSSGHEVGTGTHR